MCRYIYFPTSVLRRLQVFAGRGLLSLWRGRSRSRSKAGSWGECGAAEIVTLRPSPGRIFVQFPVLMARAFPLLTPILAPPLCYRKAACCLLLAACIHTFLRLKTHPRLVLHSSGLLGPADSLSHHQGLRSHLRHWSSVILSGADTSSWHSRPSSVLITPALLPPPASIFRKGIAQEHWIGISHQSDIVVNLSSHSAPAVTRRLGTCGNLWLIS